MLNVGAAAILAPLVTRGADERRRAELAASSARGVAKGAMWSPFFLSVAFTTQLAPHVPMWQVVGIGIATALLGFAASQAVVLVVLVVLVVPLLCAAYLARLGPLGTGLVARRAFASLGGAVSTAVFAWGLNGGLSIWSLPMAMSAAYFGIPTPRLISRRSLIWGLFTPQRPAFPALASGSCPVLVPGAETSASV